MIQPKLSQAHHVRPQWRSRMGFILAALGSAVGLGNIWRFSYLCYKNGGGAFLIPYVIALIVVGIPLMILELGIGHRMRGSAPMTFAKINRKWEWSGWWAVIAAMFGIMLYYSVVIAWCLSYVFFSANLSWGTDTNDFFFNKFLRVSETPFQIGDINPSIMYALGAVWFITWFIVYFGVQKGVERANKIFMPVLFILIGILVCWSLTLEGAWNIGIKAYLTPDINALKQPGVWIDAFSQIFFTLSLAFGIMIVYASYLPKKVDIIKDALIISVGNCLFSFIAGFAVFGTLGYMSHATGQPIDQVVSKSIGLAFITYPKAISLMPSFSRLFGIMFFTSLVIAGISSAISLVEAFAASLMDKFNVTREKIVTIVCIVGFAGSIIFCYQSGIYWVDIMDYFVTHYGLVIIGIFECIVIGWIFKASKLRDHIDHSFDKKLWPIWDICIKYVVPGALVTLLINDLVILFKDGYEGYSALALLLIGRDWLIFLLVVAFLVSLSPWKKELENKA